MTVPATGGRASTTTPAVPPAAGVRLFYIDDSGSVDTGLIVYGWIECTVPAWSTALRALLDLRKSLYEQYQIPPSAELHATKFIAGRGRPSVDPCVNMSKQDRRAVATQALFTIGQCPELRVGSVYRRTNARGSRYHTERGVVYSALVDHLDTRLTRAGEYGVILMDGNGTEHAYYDAHRGLKLSSRNIIEDPMFMPAHRSQWVQMADLAAWSAYQGVLRHEGKQFAWEWYDQYLGESDINDGPLEV